MVTNVETCLRHVEGPPEALTEVLGAARQGRPQLQTRRHETCIHQADFSSPSIQESAPWMRLRSCSGCLLCSSESGGKGMLDDAEARTANPRIDAPHTIDIGERSAMGQNNGGHGMYAAEHCTVSIRTG